MLLRGGGAAAHDRALLERPKWLVAPTLGAIVPNWLLAIPRASVLSFRDWMRGEGERPETVLEDVMGHLALAPEEIIWFEHGPVASDTSVGCGLDHAHMHILVRPTFSFATFAAEAQNLADLDWAGGAAANAYSGLEEGASYFIAGCAGTVIVASHVEGAGSQFFRRVVAKLSGLSEEWNYRHFAHPLNVERTVETFRSLESVQRRER